MLEQSKAYSLVPKFGNQKYISPFLWRPLSCILELEQPVDSWFHVIKIYINLRKSRKLDFWSGDNGE